MRNRFFFVITLVVFLVGIGVFPAHGQENFPTHRVGMIPTESLLADVKQSAWEAVHETDADKKGPMAKVGLELAVLYYQYERKGEPGIRSLQEEVRQGVGKRKNQRGTNSRLRLPVSSDGRFVTIEGVASEGPDQLLEALRDLGLDEGTAAGNLVSGRLPISAIKEAAQLSSLRGMMPSYAYARIGSVDSEADTAHGSFRVRQNFGVDGTDQKVCAMSDSYDNSDSTPPASDDIASGDLPGEGNPEGNTTPVEVLDELESGGTDEGRAMLQLIHDIAPGAALGFHTAFGGLANFASGIRELAASGCNVIVDDVGYANQPFYQDGIVSNAVDDVVDDGAVYFSSAGNNGQNSYEAPFRNSGEEGIINSSSVRHDFDPSSSSVDTEQQITVSDGGTFQVFTFQWTDPTAIVSGSSGPDTDLDIALVEQDGTILASGAEDNISMGIPAEVVIEYTNNTGSEKTINLIIEKEEGPNPDQVKYIYSGQGFSVEEFDTLGPTIYGHPMAQNAMAVGASAFVNTAAYNEDADPAVLNDFSSKGGIPIYFDQNGDRVSSPIIRQKPNVTAADGISTTFFGNDATGDGNPNFFGTSAAAPNVAAIAALMLESDPSFTPSGLYNRLESTAADITRRLTREEGLIFAGLSDGESTGPNGGEGVDDWSGHGFVQATEAVPPPAGVRITNLNLEENVDPGNSGQVEVNWQLEGQDVSNVGALVIEQRFFDGELEEREQIDRETKTTFSSTIKDLRVGIHTFRVAAVAEDGTVLQSATEKVSLQAQQPEVTVFPNPFDKRVNISFILPTEQDLTVEVFDVLGRRVAFRRRDAQAGDDPRPVRFRASELGSRSSGVYFIRVNGENFQETVQAVRIR